MTQVWLEDPLFFARMQGMLGTREQPDRCQGVPGNCPMVAAISTRIQFISDGRPSRALIVKAKLKGVDIVVATSWESTDHMCPMNSSIIAAIKLAIAAVGAIADTGQ